MKFSHSFRVPVSDIDAQGHVNNVAYVKWIQDVAVAHWFSVSTKEIREKYTWIVIRHEIDYKKQSFADEEISVKTWVGEPTRVGSGSLKSRAAKICLSKPEVFGV